MALKDQIGTFSWFSLMTKNPQAATDFYKTLFGWITTDYEIPGVGISTLYQKGDLVFGNPVPLENNIPYPSHWISYLAIEDVDEACKRAESLGGKTCVPAFDIPTIGRTAILNDPVGTAFHIFTPENKEEDMKKTGDKPGNVCWMELMLDDPTQAIPFYTEMFNWKVSGPENMGTGDYYGAEICGEQAAGFFKRPDHVPEMPPVWMPYIATENIDRSNQVAQDSNGKLILPKMEIPKTGFFSMIEDPSGAHFYLFESTM